jgi:hypothetical protein
MNGATARRLVVHRRRVGDEEDAAPVTILDGLGRVLQIVPAEEFRRGDTWRRRRERAKPTAVEE